MSDAPSDATSDAARASSSTKLTALKASPANSNQLFKHTDSAALDDVVPLNAAWAQAVVHHSSEALCVLAAETGAFIYLNDSLLRNLQFSAAELVDRLISQVAPDLDWAKLLALPGPLISTCKDSLQPIELAGNPTGISIVSSMRRRDGSGYPAELTVFSASVANAETVVIVSIRDLSERQHMAATMALIEARFRAIVSNTPGLVYQFRRMPDGSVSFPYLSEACHALLGIDPEQLTDTPDLFVAQVLADDLTSYLVSMEASAVDATTWNWEGRIHIAGWNDIKWINLRAMPRRLASGGMQWEGIMTNITQSKFAQEEIRRSRAELAELSAHVERVKEQERTRIAREIHDDLGGNLTAIKMALARLKCRLPDEKALTDKADYVDALVDRTIESIHRISVDLRPGILDFGIVAAIHWQAREFEKQAGIPCQVLANKKEIALSTEQASALFRLFQESLTNISKHAKASRVIIKLTRTASAIRLEICDNGCGLAARDQFKPKSFGIRGMIERASALGGKLTVTNADAGGTKVTMRLPLPSLTSGGSNERSDSRQSA